MLLHFKIAALLVLSAVGLLQASPASGKTGEKITIGAAALPLSAPLYVAYEEGFFDRERLQVTLERYWVGKEALDAVISGKAQFGTVAETPVVFAALQNKPVSILATIGDSKKYMKIVARKDRGIAGPQDLQGKNIGVSTGTNAPYFLDSYLTYNGISKDRVHVVPVKPEKMTEALADGTIDAAVTWNPLFTIQRKRLGANAVILENDKVYQIYWNIVAEQEYVKKHPDTVQRVLRALVRAQRYIEKHPVEAQKISARYVGENVPLREFNFDMRLGQSLVLEMEDQARWAINRGLTNKSNMPNFLRMMYVQGMESVSPESVTIVHE